LEAFGMFLQELLNIVPDPGTFYNVEPTKSCDK
jgi:hypothetical protein